MLTKNEKNEIGRCFREMKPMLERICRAKMLTGKEDIEDIISNVFCEICSYCEKYEMPENPRGWIYKVLSNMIASKFREIYRQRKNIAQYIDEAVPATESAESEAVTKIQTEYIIREIRQRISGEDMELYWMLTKREATVYETAVHTGSTINAVKQKKYRISRKIKKILNDAGVYCK